MEYTSRVPAPPLDGLIDDIYCLSGVPRHPRLNVPPMPSAHLFITMGGPVRLYDADPDVPPMVLEDGWFMGMRTRRFVIEFPSPARLVGVHFKPWGLSPFVDLPSTELRDRCVPVDGVWGRSVDRLRGRIAAVKTVGGALQVLEDELRSRLVAAPSRGLQLVTQTAGCVEAAWGNVSIGTLTKDAGVSGNHLAAQFKFHTGLTPKRLARIYRFARLILSADARGPVDWSESASSVGFFDQAHFSKEFKEFTGVTPSAYLALRRRHPADEDFPPDNGPMPAE
ncbi:helix-turn-helix domain-containing protein [Jiangella endophytica]|uniref:helix-turn-helix domain-containing protein n=1 Tax=Jiangella endophytica TaxID=1623398 RepID=UPI000E34FAEF|nr:helix-turn-helix domain-containing protein [Jiangella endophytica]